MFSCGWQTSHERVPYFLLIGFCLFEPWTQPVVFLYTIKNTLSLGKSVFGDPYEIRTRDAAVKGRSLNHLTNGPSGSDNWIRTNDTAGMNRML